MATVQNFLLTDIQPNPHRWPMLSPLDRRKIDVLRESIAASGLWCNITVRCTPEGIVQQVYGHHRLQAAKELAALGLIPNRADFIVEDLSDGDMLLRLTQENKEDAKKSVLITAEQIANVVYGLSIGLYAPFSLPLKGRQDKMVMRYTPNIQPGKGRGEGQRYTAPHIARILGRSKDTVMKTAFELLECEERGLLKNYRHLFVHTISTNIIRRTTQDLLEIANRKTKPRSSKRYVVLSKQIIAAQHTPHKTKVDAAVDALLGI